jgi:acyl-[acyl carrier protein]--UDP-N-acetylglucosamine O-acyltransferase
MEKQKFKVLNVYGLTPKQLEEEMNNLVEQGYKRVFQSTIEWYQGKGEWGVITFELKED